jgi:hypothetical protein
LWGKVETLNPTGDVAATALMCLSKLAIGCFFLYIPLGGMWDVRYGMCDVRILLR